MGFSQNVSYIFEGFTYPKCKLHFGEVPPAKRVGILWHPFYILRPSARSLGTNKLLVLPNRLGKRTRIYNHLPQLNACQTAFGT